MTVDFQEGELQLDVELLEVFLGAPKASFCQQVIEVDIVILYHNANGTNNSKDLQLDVGGFLSYHAGAKKIPFPFILCALYVSKFVKKRDLLSISTQTCTLMLAMVDFGRKSKPAHWTCT